MASEQIILQFDADLTGLAEAATAMRTLGQITEQQEKQILELSKKSTAAFKTQTAEITKETSALGKLNQNLKQTTEAIAGAVIKKGTDEMAKFGTEVVKTANETQKLTTQLRNLKNQLADPNISADKFQKLSIEAAKLEDRIGDVSQRIRVMASDTFAIDAIVDGVRGMTAAFTIAQSASALFGKENEDLQKALLKVQAATGLLIGVQEIANQVTGQGAAKLAILSGAKKVYTFVTTGATAATRLFNAALVGLGIGAVIAGVVALVTYWKDIAKFIGLANDEQDEFANKSEDFFTKNANAVSRLKEGLDISQKSTKDLNTEIEKLKEHLDQLPRKNSISAVIFNGQTIKQDATKARETLLAEIDKLEKELEKRAQSNKKSPGSGITPLTIIEPGQLPTQEIKIKPVLDEEAMEQVQTGLTKIQEEQAQFEKEKQETIRDTAIQGFSELQSALSQLSNQRRDAEFAAEFASLEKEKEAKLAAAGDSASKRAAIEAQYAQKERQLKREQFIRDKQAKLGEAVMNGFLAITTTIAKLGAPIPPNFAAIAGVALAGLTTALNAAQIRSTPIPAFEKGTKNAPPGMKLVGEKGPELINDKGGYEIIPHNRTMEILNAYHSNFLLPEIVKPKSQRQEAQSQFNVKELGKEIGKQLASNPRLNVSLDENGFNLSIREGLQTKQYLNKRHSFK